MSRKKQEQRENHRQEQRRLLFPEHLLKSEYSHSLSPQGPAPVHRVCAWVFCWLELSPTLLPPEQGPLHRRLPNSTHLSSHRRSPKVLRSQKKLLAQIVLWEQHPERGWLLLLFAVAPAVPAIVVALQCPVGSCPRVVHCRPWG